MRARWVLATMGIIVAAQDVLEHVLVYGKIDPLLWIKVGMYAVIFPVLGWALLRPLQEAERARERLEKTMGRQLERLRQLSDASQGQALGQYLVEFPRDFFPVEESVFYLTQEGDQHTHVAAWVREGGESTSPEQVHICPVCQVNSGVGFHAIPVEEPGGWPERPGWFSLPLTLGEQRLGMLFMRLPEEYHPQPETVRLLDKAALEMAFAIDRARLRDMLANRAAEDTAARRELARDLHDVLGQNIAYLRMKLEDLSETNGGTDMAADLRRLTEIAGESYTQVRQVLFELNNQPSQGFEQQLAVLLQVSAQRCPVEFRVEQRGKPLPLGEAVQRQVLYICREALNNIEKHVCKGAVLVILDWAESSLRLTIRDEGAGFDPANIPDGHYGLQNMRERAEAVGASLKVTSAPDQGTAVELVVEKL